MVTGLWDRRKMGFSSSSPRLAGLLEVDLGVIISLVVEVIKLGPLTTFFTIMNHLMNHKDRIVKCLSREDCMHLLIILSLP